MSNGSKQNKAKARLVFAAGCTLCICGTLLAQFSELLSIVLVVSGLALAFNKPGVARKQHVDDALPVPPGGLGTKKCVEDEGGASQQVEDPLRRECPEVPARDPHGELDSLILRSSDVIASLADLVRHGDAEKDLRKLVERSGMLEWQDAPRAEAKMLNRSGRWWLFSKDELPDADYDRMVAVELLLNLADELHYRAQAEGDSPLEDQVSKILAGIDGLEPFSEPDEATRFLSEGAEKGGEWATRLAIADYAESLPVPVRIDASLQVNVADGIAVVDAEVQRPAAFAAASPDEAARAGIARDYAMRLCLALGRGAFGASERIERVVVNGHEHGTRTPVISVDFTRTGLEHLRDEMAELPAGELPRGLGIRWFTSADGRLAPVDPIMAKWDDGIAPLSRWTGVEQNRLAATPAIAAATKARTMSDLGINEKYVRIEAWNEAAGWLGLSTRRAVAAFEARRHKASDRTVAEACERVSRALVEGKVDVFDRQSMAFLFVEGGELATAVRDVAVRINGKPGHTSEDLEAELARLYKALEPAAQTARYEDDTENVFRYFNSMAERVRYNLEVDNDNRELRLVPDEYYAAHSQATQLLVTLGRHEEALAHARENVRIAPYTTDAVLAEVRCLEELSRIYEAVDALKLAIERASSVREMSICFYRLAFMEWKLGHGPACVACYQRAMELHGEIRERAAHELGDVLAADNKLSKFSHVEAREVILAEGIPYGDVDAIRTMIRDAAVACTDAGVLSAARPLAGMLLEADGDDVLQDVFTSLGPSRP